MDNHGSVTYKGHEYILLEEAFANQWGIVRPTYSARAIRKDEAPDEHGNVTVYIITWNVKDDFIFFDWYDCKWYYIGGEDETPEENLCEWDTPESVVEY